MDNLTVSLAMIIGILLRLGIPLLATILVIYWLRKLDQHWQVEGKSSKMQRTVSVSHVGNTGCWNVRACSESSRSKCAAYQHPETPCWQLFRDPYGRMREGCIGCQVFREAPIPA